jgi:hypothetical protein
MKVIDLIDRLKQLNPESQIEFVGLTEYGYGEQLEITTTECHIQEEGSLVQIVISGEEN